MLVLTENIFRNILAITYNKSDYFVFYNDIYDYEQNITESIKHDISEGYELLYMNSKDNEIFYYWYHVEELVTFNKNLLLML